MTTENVYDSLETPEKARWIALLMAIDHIDVYCREKNKDFNEVVCLKPIPIKHFIEEKHKQIQYALQLEEDLRQQNSLLCTLRTHLTKRSLKTSPSNTSPVLFAKA
jgi:hypothetical protein